MMLSKSAQSSDLLVSMCTEDWLSDDHKLFQLVLSKIAEQDVERYAPKVGVGEPITVSASDYAEVYGATMSNIHSDFDNSTSTLARTAIKIERAGHVKKMVMPLFQCVRIHHDEKVRMDFFFNGEALRHILKLSAKPTRSK